MKEAILSNYYSDYNTYKSKLGLYDPSSLKDKCLREQNEVIKLWFELDRLSGNADEYNLGGFWNNLLLNDLYDNPHFKDRDRFTNTLFYIQKIKPVILKHIEKFQ